VVDGNTSTYWSPSGSTGSVSVKWGSATTVSKVNVRLASGSGTIGAYRLLNHDTGAVLATGSGSGTVAFSPVSLKKITLEITNASGTPRIAEFETYAS
jgi:pectate lyase